MSARNNGGPAFPRPASVDTSGGTLPDGDFVVKEQSGMTLRDYFAGQVLVGLLADGFELSDAKLAEACYVTADAMLAERAK